MRITRIVGLLFGGIVTLVGVMGVVGLVTGNFLARLLVALLLVIGIPALITDRVLKRMKTGGNISIVSNAFTIILLGFALVLVSLEFLSKPLFVGEGDHYAASGSRGMARFSYWLGGVSPIFPEERGLPAQASAGDAGAPDAGTEGGKP